jgi:hypothetical protein
MENFAGAKEAFPSITMEYPEITLACRVNASLETSHPKPLPAHRHALKRRETQGKYIAELTRDSQNPGTSMD